MLFFTFGVVAVLSGLSLGVIHAFVEDQVQRDLSRDLQSTRSVFEKFLRERATWLRSQCWVVAEDPRFTATLDIPDPDLDEHARTVLPVAKQFLGLINSDFFAVTNHRGQILARIEVQRRSGEDLRSLPGVREALEGRAAAAIWDLQGQTLHVAIVPAADGALAMGFPDEVDQQRLRQFLAPFAARVHSAPPPAEVDALFQEVQRAIAPDMMALVDADGTARSLVVCRAEYGGDLAAAPGVRQALTGADWTGLQALGDRLFQTVAVPVWSQDQLVGTLSAGFQIDDRLARDLRDMTGSQVTFALGEHLLASSWSGALRTELEDRLAGLQATSGAAFAMDLGSESFLTLMEDPAEEGQGARYLIQSSLDQATRFLSTLETVLLLLGAGVLLGAALISFPGVARITRPVEALVEGTRRLAAGDLSYRIPVESDGEIGELATSFNDMGRDLARSRGALLESERLYRDLFDNAQDLVYTTDAELRLTSINRAGVRLLAYREEELIGLDIRQLLDAPDAELFRSHVHGEAPSAFEVEMKCGDGRRAVLEIVSRWIVEDQRPVGTHGVGRDLSERRERERATHRFREQLAQAEKLRALGEMAAGVAHNFNNLLTVVMGYAQLIEMEEEVPEAIRANNQKIIESARRCSAIVRRIQTFGRPINFADTALVDLGRVIRDTVDLTRPRWKTASEREGRTIRIELDLAEIPSIETQGAAWEEILSNLIFNAVDAMPEGGLITLSTGLEGGETIVRVADTGTGMDEQTRRRVFEPFFTTKDPERGTGLGLSTVWGLVQAMGGRIDIDSQPGQGTTFAIRVPTSRPPQPRRAEEESNSLPTGLDILIVDDEPTVLELLPSLLSGHRVDAAGSGPEGRARVRRHGYDLIITDWVMAEVSGLEIAQEAKRHHPESVVALMTGWQLQGSAADGHPDIDLIMAKPFTGEDVKKLLRRVVGLRHNRPVDA